MSDDIAISLGHDAGFINMSRIGSFYDAEQARTPDMTGLGSIAPNDIDDWIEASDIIVDESAEVTVSGRTAQLRTVRAPPAPRTESARATAELHQPVERVG